MSPRWWTRSIWWRSVPANVYRGGEYSFVSSHAANHMGVAVLFGGLLGGAWGWGLLAWALLIGFSRIHLGVHYPGDVLGRLRRGMGHWRLGIDGGVPVVRRVGAFELGSPWLKGSRG